MVIHCKDDIKFVTEFPCFLGHPVYKRIKSIRGSLEGKVERGKGRPGGGEVCEGGGD